MILLTTRITTENIEQYLELSKKEEDAEFEYVARLEGKVGIPS